MSHDAPLTGKTRKETWQWFGRFIWENRIRLLVWMLAIGFVGAAGGIGAYVRDPVDTVFDLVARAFLGIGLAAFVGIGVYTLLVGACMIGPRRKLGWEGVPPTVLRLGIASLGDLLLVLIVGVVTAVVVGPKYPIDLCHCAEIDKANSYEISLVDKQSSLVLLTPSVKVVKRIGSDAVILSNLKSNEVKENPNGYGGRYWDLGAKYAEEGYFLLRCEKTPVLVRLGTDRDNAVAKAMALAGEQH